MNTGTDLEAPELDQPVLELQSGQEAAAVLRQQQAAGTTGAALPIAQGGTGANTAAAALSNLGAAPSNASYIVSSLSSGLSAEALLSMSALTLLATATLNLNTNTKQPLYTVPVGRSGIPLLVIGRSPSVDLSTGITTFLTFGFNAGANDWSTTNNYSTVSLVNAGLFLPQSQEVASGNQPAPFGSAGQTFGAITDAAFGSAATLVIMVLGTEF